MVEPLGLIKLDFLVHQRRIVTQALLLTNNSPSILKLDCLSSSSDLSFFNFQTPQAHLVAFLYQYPDESKNFAKLSALLYQNQSPFIGLFSEAETEQETVFVLAHSSDTTGFGEHIKGAKIGMFKYNLKEVIKNSIQSYLKLIQLIKTFKSTEIRISTKTVQKF